MSGTIEARLVELDIQLPPPHPPVGFYLPVLQTGSLVITSGQLPFVGKELPFKGKLGDHIHEEEGHNAARICALNALSLIKECVGDLDCVKRIVRVEGYVQSAAGFHNQANVINGASEFLVEVFGEIGKHTRTAVGVTELPLNAAVEVAVWAEV